MSISEMQMNANAKLHGNTPVGRLVEGSLTHPSTVDMYGKPRAKPEFFFGIAVRKDEPSLPGLFGQIYNHAHAGYQQHPYVQQRMLTPVNPHDPNAMRYISIGMKGIQFAWKIGDGDQPNDRGVLNPDAKGCWIWRFKSTYAPNTVDRNNVKIDPASIKLGAFVDVAFSTSVNGKVDHTAGLYMNPVFVRFIAFGQEIDKGISAEEAFRNAAVPAHLPPGASLTPIAPAGSPGMVPGGVAPGVPAMAGSAPHHPHGQAPHASSPAVSGQPVMGNGVSHAPATHQPASPSHGTMPATSSHPAPHAAQHGQYSGGQVAANPTPAPSLPAVSAAPSAMTAQPASHLSSPAAVPSPGATTGISPSDAGNGGQSVHAPAVQAAQVGALPAGSMPAGSLPVNASPTEQVPYSPHPGFVHGGQAA
jgi:hypothetical protein